MTANLRAVTYLGPLFLMSVLGSASCSSTTRNSAATGGMAGATAAGGTAGAGATSSGGTAGSASASGGAPVIGLPSTLPMPPGDASVPRPSGAADNLKILDWAGFKSAVTYSLDDAQPSQIEHYAELQATGVRMTFFVTTGNANGNAAVNSTFTQAVLDGHEMGNHTVHHCHSDLSGCSTGSALSLDVELDACSTYITEHFGQPAVWTAASPYGDTGYDKPDQSRVFLNRGVQSGSIGANDASDPFNLPVHAAVDGESVASFNTVIDSSNSAGKWLIFLIHTLAPTAAIWYAPIDISVVTESVSHAQSLDGVWIDSMVNVGAYWRAQKIVSSVTSTHSGDSETWSWSLPAHFPGGRYLRVIVDGGTLSQAGTSLPWDSHGYYEVALDAGEMTLSP